MQNKDDKKTRDKAVVLKYELGKEKAPRVVAKGRGKTAEKIKQVAKEHGVKEFKDEVLSEALMNVEIEQQIPEALYEVVAQVLAFVYALDEKY